MQWPFTHLRNCATCHTLTPVLGYQSNKKWQIIQQRCTLDVPMDDVREDFPEQKGLNPQRWMRVRMPLGIPPSSLKLLIFLVPIPASLPPYRASLTLGTHCITQVSCQPWWASCLSFPGLQAWTRYIFLIILLMFWAGSQYVSLAGL